MAELRERCPVAHTTAHGGAYVVTLTKTCYVWPRTGRRSRSPTG